MPAAIRVKLSPKPFTAMGGSAEFADKCVVSLVQFGAGLSAAKRGAAVSATIQFNLTQIPNALSAASERVTTQGIATLSGSLSLSPSDASPRFVVSSFDATATPPVPSDVPSEQRQPRTVHLELESKCFELPPDLNALALTFDDRPENGFDHVELSVQLSVDGSTEAADGTNDVLDLPLLPQKVVDLRLVDQVGAPIPSIGVTFSLPDGDVPLTTDSNGAARIVNPPGDVLPVKFDDPDSLRATVKARWAKVQPGRLLSEADPGTQVVLGLKDPLDELLLSTGTTRVSIQPDVTLARLKGLFFETGKSFLLPASVAIFDEFAQTFSDNDGRELLIVAHADTVGANSTNDELSLERADNTAAYLRDDVEAWLKMYGTKTPAARRWGADEDEAMFESLADFITKSATEDSVTWFQRTRGLSKVDGKAGDDTRRALIKEYMALDATTLGPGSPFDINITTHGCGEFFPLDATGNELDGAPKDNSDDQTDRRVELFFFDRQFGIQPAPPGKNSKKDSNEYPEWRRRATLKGEFEAGQRERMLLSVPIDPAFPWTDNDSVLVLAANSAVVLQKRIGDGLALGATRVFRIPRHEVGKLYRAEVHVQQDTFVLFDQLPSTTNGDSVML